MIPSNSYAAQGKPLPPAREENFELRNSNVELPTARRATVSLPYEPANFLSRAAVSNLQSALRSAEAGQTRDLFALYRDMMLGGSHLQSEFAKRKMPVLSEPHSIQPIDKKNAEDVKAADAIKWMIDECATWLDGLTFAMDSCLWPVSLMEKVFMPAPKNALGLRWALKELSPVPYTLLCFQPDTGRDGRAAPSELHNSAFNLQPSTQWEPDVRIHLTNADGAVDYSYNTAYPVGDWRNPPPPLTDPLITGSLITAPLHVVHRGHLLVGVRDNFGGPMRAVMMWAYLATMGRDWFSQAMERYGSPFTVAKTNTEDAGGVAFLESALARSKKLFGLVVDENTQIELKEAMVGNLAAAYETFLNVCNREQSKIILGQTLSATADATGLGSGTSNLHGEVREDVMRFDRRKLGETLRNQLFAHFLAINGLTGQPPRIVWGGLSVADAKAQAEVISTLSNASLEPTDEALPQISEKVGFEVQRKAAPEPMPGFGGTSSASPHLKAAALHALSASPIVRMDHPSDKIARERAASLARAFRGDLAPVATILSASESPDQFLKALQRHFADWKPARTVAVAEEALQMCAAEGAGQRVSQ